MVKCMNGELKVGQKVAYPGRQSSSLWMNIATVLEVGTRPHRWRPDTTYGYIKVKTESGRKTQTVCLDRVVIIEQPPQWTNAQGEACSPVDDPEVCS